MSIAVTPADLTNAARTLRGRADAVQALPRGHGVAGRSDLLGALDDSHRFLSDGIHDLRRWIDELTGGLDLGASDYISAEAALAGAITSSNVEGS